jgi:hypothetical protein
MISLNNCFSSARLVILAVLITISGGIVVAQQQRTSEESGRVKGVVVDWNYARIVESCVIFRSKTHQTRVKVNDEGAFDVELTAGTYEVVALSPNFSRVRMKNVRVEPGVTRTLNFMLPVAPEISGRCPANTVRRGDLCESLCENLSPAKDVNPIR